jgi:hypothetical protein
MKEARHNERCQIIEDLLKNTILEIPCMSLSDIDNEIEEYLKDKNMHCLE